MSSLLLDSVSFKLKSKLGDAHSSCNDSVGGSAKHKKRRYHLISAFSFIWCPEAESIAHSSCTDNVGGSAKHKKTQIPFDICVLFYVVPGGGIDRAQLVHRQRRWFLQPIKKLRYLMTSELFKYGARRRNRSRTARAPTKSVVLAANKKAQISDDI